MRVLWIPIAGTIAAVLAIALAHPEQESNKYPIELPQADKAKFEKLRKPPEPEGPAKPEGATDGDAPGESGEEDAGEARDFYDLRLLKDGTLRDADTGRSFKDGAAVANALGQEGDRKPVVRVRNEDGVSESALDAVGAALKGRCRFEKDYRAPK